MGRCRSSWVKSLKLNPRQSDDDGDVDNDNDDEDDNKALFGCINASDAMHLTR